MAVSSWKMMREGDKESALLRMKERFAKAWKPEYSMPSCGSEVMELGVAYLWLEDYLAAKEHFDFYNQQYPRHSHDTYDMAGTAMWCMGKRAEAVHQWQRGLDVDYADVGYGITPPLLLFFASVVQPSLYSRTEAESLLAERLADPRANRWPAPLAQYMIGRIDFPELQQMAVWKGRDDITADNYWQAGFWRGVSELQRGNTINYRNSMRETANVSWADYDRDNRDFLGKLWCPEFFLARHEAK